MRLGRRLVIACAAACVLARGAALRAQPQPDGDGEPALAKGPAVGPLIVIEAIEIAGNSITAGKLIRRALPVHEGDELRAGDERIRIARFKVLALGYFRDVTLEMRKGSRRGRVILTVRVVERGTVVLERLYFGQSQLTPWWFGADLTERNLLGSGLAVGGAFVAAGQGDEAGARSQQAAMLRVEDPSVFGATIGWHAAAQLVRASEPYRVRGADGDGAASNFAAFDYRRLGARAGVSFNLTPLARLSLDGRFEAIDATLPRAPTRLRPDGSSAPVALDLEPGRSRVATISLGFDRDSRPDPVLPYAGDHVVLYGELGAAFLGSSYDYGVLLGRFERWWPLGSTNHVLSLHLMGGVVVGQAPRFEHLHVGDLNRMVSPRALGLVVSSTTSYDLLDTATAGVTYGQVGGVATTEYAYRLFRRHHGIYGGDLFVAAGLWSLAQIDQLRARDTSFYRALPVDLLLDCGVRIDTEVGIFELSIANALGRVPL